MPGGPPYHPDPLHRLLTRLLRKQVLPVSIRSEAPVAEVTAMAVDSPQAGSTRTSHFRPSHHCKTCSPASGMQASPRRIWMAGFSVLLHLPVLEKLAVVLTLGWSRTLLSAASRDQKHEAVVRALHHQQTPVAECHDTSKAVASKSMRLAPSMA
mmetsp:Transcript_115299/g.288076  ORF Transcript_115299/g.288076 Transcript_115299/m.288076 type:complete len:154 (+) Transcript_115299:1181-1642(+)